MWRWEGGKVHFRPQPSYLWFILECEILQAASQQQRCIQPHAGRQRHSDLKSRTSLVNTCHLLHFTFLLYTLVLFCVLFVSLCLCGFMFLSSRFRVYRVFSDFKGRCPHGQVFCNHDCGSHCIVPMIMTLGPYSKSPQRQSQLGLIRQRAHDAAS